MELRSLTLAKSIYYLINYKMSYKFPDSPSASAPPPQNPKIILDRHPQSSTSDSFGWIAYKQALHLGKAREVTREQYAKGDACTRGEARSLMTRFARCIPGGASIAVQQFSSASTVSLILTFPSVKNTSISWFFIISVNFIASFWFLINGNSIQFFLGIYRATLQSSYCWGGIPIVIVRIQNCFSVYIASKDSPCL